MPILKPSRKFLEDAEAFGANSATKKNLAKALWLLEGNPLHSGLHLERIVNDPSAWSVRIDRQYRLSLDPEAYLPAGNPDWSAAIILLRILGHDDLYRRPR